MTEIQKLILTAKEAFEGGRTKPYEFRKNQLLRFKKMVKDNETQMVEALKKDLNKSTMEAYLTEIDLLVGEIDTALDNLEDWMKPEPVPKNIITIFDQVQINSDPRGVVLVIGAWNYPINITLSPVVGAIAAGNCVVIKPSEVSANAAKLIAELVPKYLDNECYPVFTGGPAEMKELLKEKFDHIMFTGSTTIGRIIYEAAQKHLTPVTLELGGKSPLYIDNTVNIKVAAKRIVWGKCVNAGQTCIAPDYILCTKEVEKLFVTEVKSILKNWYGDNIQNSNDYCRIINDRHFARLTSMINASQVAVGGNYDDSERYIAPTVLTNVKLTDPIMQEEIFGPILPIISVENAHEAIAIINKSPKPLTFYIFSNNKKIQNILMDNVTSGSVLINDTLIQFGVGSLPFGGVGDSGIGAYHGKYSFDTFSHKKSCLIKDYNVIGETLAGARYPPYNSKKLALMKMLVHMKLNLKCLKYLRSPLLLGAGFLFGFFYNKCSKEMVHHE